MITLYLDHQVYSYLKNKDNTQYFQGSDGEVRRQAVLNLYTFLLKNKGNFLIFYSHAHLLDLSSDKSGNRERLQDDLKCRAEWAENNYLLFDEKLNQTDYQLAYPEEAFEPFSEKEDEIDFSSLFDVSGFEDVLDDDKLEELNQHKALLRNFKFPTLDELTSIAHQQSDDYKKMKEMFQFMDGKTFPELLNGFMKFSKQFQEEKGFYKGMRNIVASGIQKAKNMELPGHTPETKFMVDLGTVDLNSKEKETFIKNNLLDLVRSQWKNRNKENDKEPTSFDLHYQSYLMLDMMGIEMEKATIARNMLHDAQHSFYGGNCEVVVSDDKAFRAKSKLLYQLFGLDTQVLSIVEFMQQSFFINLEEVNTITDFSHRVKDDLNTKLITPSRLTSLFNYVSELKPSMRYLHYFNKMLIVSDGIDPRLVFRHNVSSYLKYTPYKIIQTVCNKTVGLFGLDMNGVSNYNWDAENNEINQGKWRGRLWRFNGVPIELQLRGSYLQLVVG